MGTRENKNSPATGRYTRSHDPLADSSHPATRPDQPTAQTKPDCGLRVPSGPVERFLVPVVAAQAHRDHEIEEMPVKQFPGLPIRGPVPRPIDQPAAPRALGYKPQTRAQHRCTVGAGHLKPAAGSACRECPASQTRRRISVPLVPPKPKEFFMAASMRIERALPDT